MNRRPLVIELTGTPNSGKTTLVHALRDEFSKKGYNVKVMQEDSELVPPEIPKKTWVRNAWITFGQLQSLLEIPYSGADIVLLDRGYYDALFWAKFLLAQKVATEEEASALLNLLYSMNESFHLQPDCLLVIDVSVEESLRRRRELGGNIVLSNSDFISLYRNELHMFCMTISSLMMCINTTFLSKEEAFSEVFSFVSSLTEKN